MSEIKEETMFDEMRKAGSGIPDKVEYLQANGWESYKHHDNWVKSTWLDLEKDGSLLDLNAAFYQCVKEQIVLQEAVKTLCTSLKEDKGLYIAYQANIAMAFQDEFRREQIRQNDFTKWLFLEGGLHTIANNAAYYFLNLLISEPDPAQQR